MNRRTFIAASGTLPWAFAGCAHRARLAADWTRLPPLPNALGVAAPFAGVAGDSLLVAGGANFPHGFPWDGGKKVWHDTIYRLDAPDIPWTVAGKLPRPLAYGVSISTPDGLVCVGGSDAARHYSEVFRLFTRGQSLRSEPMAPVPEPIANATGALVGNHILLCGGATEPGETSALNQLWSLDLSRTADGWRELPALPAEPRFLAIAGTHEDGFYVFGGVSLTLREKKPARVYLNDAWRYRLGGGWQRLANLPYPMCASPSPAPIIGHEILLLPGDDGSQFAFQPAVNDPGFPRRVVAYDIQRNAWREGNKIPFAQVTTPCVRWRNRIIVPSGEVRPGVRSPEVWSLLLP